MNSTVEVGKTYRKNGGDVYRITEVRPDGTIIGARFIKTSQRFSGQEYDLAWPGSPKAAWEEVSDPTI